MTALHDAARQAALDERDRRGWPITDYQVGCLVETALAVTSGHTYVEANVVDVEGWEE